MSKAGVLVAALLLVACGTLPTVTALDALLPGASKALTLAAREAFGAEPDTDTAECVHLPEIGEDSGYVYVVCRAKGVWLDEATGH